MPAGTGVPSLTTRPVSRHPAYDATAVGVGEGMSVVAGGELDGSAGVAGSVTAVGSAFEGSVGDSVTVAA